MLRSTTVLSCLCLLACAEPTAPTPPGEPVDDPTAVTDVPAEDLAAPAPAAGATARWFSDPGEACSPVACAPGQCGVVADGCRAEMWCGDCACAASAMTCERSLAPLVERTVPANVATVVSVTNLSPGAAAAIHVLDPAGNELAFDQVNPTVVVTASAQGGSRTVIVRARDAGSTGSATVSINGVSQLLAIGGTFHVVSNVRAGEELETTRLFGSDLDRHALMALDASGHVIAHGAGSGAAGGARITLTQAASQRTLVAGNLVGTNSHARIFRNDRALAGHDTDGDGLGNELETALGTCGASGAQVSLAGSLSFDCNLASDPRDSDSDGLPDPLEVRGTDVGGVALPLPLWGADPRHKDLFLELDASQLVAGGPDVKLTARDARRLSDYYGDRTRDLPAWVAQLHAGTLENPDWQPGVRTHVDLGVAPESPADVRVYGDWGGHSVVPPAGAGGQHPMSAYPTHLAAGRRGIFRYGMVYPGGGGSTATGTSGCVGCGVYAWASGADLDTFFHESMHAHGLAHSGPAGLPAADANCKPLYPSNVNYAYQFGGPGFSDRLGLVSLNNVGVRETGVLPAGAEILTTLGQRFAYRVESTTGSVDWNRDGQFSPAGTLVRAYTNYQPGASCEFTRQGFGNLPAASATQVSPAIGRWGSTTYVFSGGTTSLRYATSTSAFNCPQPSATPCGTWSATSSLTIDSTRGVDAARITDPSGRQGLLVVTAGADGRLFYTIRELSASGFPRWTNATQIPIFALSAGEPALVGLPDGRALLVVRHTTGLLVQAFFRYTGVGAGNWDTWSAVQDPQGNQLFASASPGLVNASFTGVGPRTYGLFTTAAQPRLSLFRLDPVTLRWSDSGLLLDQATGPSWPFVSSRPAAVFVADATNALGGRLHVYTAAADEVGNGTGRFMLQRTTYAPRDGLIHVGLAAGYDSDWSYTYGVDAWFDPGVDTNVRVAWSISPLTDASTPGYIRFDPKADGLTDFVQEPYDDWPVMGYALCKALQSGLSSPTVDCGARPW